MGLWQARVVFTPLCSDSEPSARQGGTKKVCAYSFLRGAAGVMTFPHSALSTFQTDSSPCAVHLSFFAMVSMLKG